MKWIIKNSSGWSVNYLYLDFSKGGRQYLIYEHNNEVKDIGIILKYMLCENM